SSTHVANAQMGTYLSPTLVLERPTRMFQHDSLSRSASERWQISARRRPAQPLSTTATASASPSGSSERNALAVARMSDGLKGDSARVPPPTFLTIRRQGTWRTSGYPF